MYRQMVTKISCGKTINDKIRPQKETRKNRRGKNRKKNKVDIVCTGLSYMHVVR